MKMKNANTASTADLIKQKKESGDLKTDNLKLSSEKRKGKRTKRSEKSLGELRNTIRRNNIYIMAI